MKEKKNIDNIFKEGFNNLEATPSPRVWENIQAELNKEKKERKVIPLWIKLGGVAALLALLLTVGNSLYNSPDIMDGEQITNENFEQNNKNLQKTRSTSEIQNAKVATEDITTQNSNSSEKIDAKDKNETRASNKTVKGTSEKATNIVVASSNSEKEKAIQKQTNSESHISKNISTKELNEGIATSQNPSEKTTLDKTEKKASDKFINSEKEIIIKNNEGVAEIDKSKDVNSKVIPTDTENGLVKAEAEIKQDSVVKKSIFDAIAKNIEEDESEKKKKQKPEHRWKIAPNVAPVYYSSLGNGSSIDPTFTDNPQKGDVNMSYGVQVSYAVSNRLSVRTGLNNVDLSYSTSDILVGTGPVSSALRTVDYGGKQIVTTVVSKSTFHSSAPSGGFENINLKSTQGNARVIQNINYYEIPVELKYSLLDTRLGLNLIGGLSTLVLGNNEISVKADNFSTVLGEANNLSDVSFSTNIGLGLDYKLSKKFTFNIEPMFKYQLNPYTDSSVNFKPYYLGVYSGISFKF